MIDDVLQGAVDRRDPTPNQGPKSRARLTLYRLLDPRPDRRQHDGRWVWGIGFLLVNFRIAKLLKCFIATPMPRRDFLALLGTRMTFLIPDLTMLLLLGTVVSRCRSAGASSCYLIDVLGALAFAGIGLLVASRAQTTETVSGLMNLVMLPMWFFSGVFFSSERFGDVRPVVHSGSAADPAHERPSRVILEGAVPRRRSRHAILAVWAIGSFLLALKLFRWT